MLQISFFFPTHFCYFYYSDSTENSLNYLNSIAIVAILQYHPQSHSPPHPPLHPPNHSQSHRQCQSLSLAPSPSPSHLLHSHPLIPFPLPLFPSSHREIAAAENCIFPRTR